MKIVILFFLLILPLLAYPQLVGKVISVADGDTFTMLDDNNRKIKIRLYGIDCPEMDQESGDSARKYLVVLFRLHYDSVEVYVKGKDKYGRKVGVAYTGKTNINESILAHGLAWHYTQFDKNPDWSRMEKEARLLGFHIWSTENPVPPWKWRSQKRKKN
jgi:endonuclease YncB( thermonuclease family)